VDFSGFFFVTVKVLFSSRANFAGVCVAVLGILDAQDWRIGHRAFKTYGRTSISRRSKSALHMPPPATVSGCDLPRVELSGDGVETGMARRLDVPNDRQHVGRKLSRLLLTSHAHALDDTGGSGMRAQSLSKGLVRSDMFSLVFGVSPTV
jgi:hypothetical protein